MDSLLKKSSEIKFFEPKLSQHDYYLACYNLTLGHLQSKEISVPLITALLKNPEHPVSNQELESPK